MRTVLVRSTSSAVGMTCSRARARASVRAHTAQEMVGWDRLRVSAISDWVWSVRRYLTVIITPGADPGLVGCVKVFLGLGCPR